jgi:serine/threonine protein kinase
MGEVHLAYDQNLDREVALKILRLEGAEDSAQARFGREAELLAHHPHPGIVNVLDLSLQNDPPFLVLEWMPGGDLAGLLRSGPSLETEEVIRIGLRLARALAHLHSHGILHRDIKPENILLDADGEVALADLGLALDSSGDALTRTGHVVGTPVYMASEVLERAIYSPASDLYSLAVVLAELATGRRLGRPASLGNAAQELTRQVEPSALRRLLRHCLRENSEARLQDAAALIRELEAIEGVPLHTAVLGSSHADSTLSQDVHTARPGSWWPSVARRNITIAVVCVGLAGLFGATMRIRGTTPPPATTPPSGSAVGPTSPFDEGLARRLESELEQALGYHWDDQGHQLVGAGTHSFPSAFSLYGVVILDRLPTEAEVLRWLSHGGTPERLTDRDRAALRKYDLNLSELGFPPTFRPFLNAAPRPFTGEIPEILLHLPRVPPLAVPPPDHPSAGWWQAAAELLARGAEVQEELTVAYRGGELELDGLLPSETRHLAVFTGQDPDSVSVLAGSLRGSPAGRDRLREILGEGREIVRDFMVAAAYALDSPDPPDIDLHIAAAEGGVLTMNGFLLGTLLSASRDRLFGPTGKTAACLEFQGRVLTFFDRLREHTAIPGELPQDAPEVWRRAFEATPRTGPPARAARVWAGWLHALDNHLRGEDFTVAYWEHQSVFRRHLPPAARLLLDEQLARAMSRWRGTLTDR